MVFHMNIVKLNVFYHRRPCAYTYGFGAVKVADGCEEAYTYIVVDLKLARLIHINAADNGTINRRKLCNLGGIAYAAAVPQLFP